MDTDDLNQLEKQLHELFMICVDLRKENDALKLQLKKQDEQIQTLEQQKALIDGKVGHLLSSLEVSEPGNE